MNGHLVGLIHAEYLRMDMSCCIPTRNSQDQQKQPVVDKSMDDKILKILNLKF
jgi:hypothetical protein